MKEPLTPWSRPESIAVDALYRAHLRALQEARSDGVLLLAAGSRVDALPQGGMVLFPARPFTAHATIGAWLADLRVPALLWAVGVATRLRLFRWLPVSWGKAALALLERMEAEGL